MMGLKRDHDSMPTEGDVCIEIETPSFHDDLTDHLYCGKICSLFLTSQNWFKLKDSSCCVLQKASWPILKFF